MLMVCTGPFPRPAADPADGGSHGTSRSSQQTAQCGGRRLTVLTPTPAPARPAAPPNAVLTWNVHAQTAIYETGRQSPTAGARSFAMVQGAVYDAVNAIAGTPYQPYLAAPRAHRGDSIPAAVATAAYRVLLSIFPAQADALRTQYDEALAAIPEGPAQSNGIRVGEAAATA
jgi:hypothetical protein